MKDITLPTRILKLPECWEDLTTKQLLYTVQQLQYLCSGAITETQFKQLLLINYTGYKHSLLKDAEERDNVMHNLITLAELITFPLRARNGHKEANNIFASCPLPFVRIGIKKHHLPRFTLGVMIDTDITAIQYADTFDLARAYAITKQEEVLNRFISTLCPSIPLKKTAKMHPLVKWIIWFWFTGIIDFFALHPVYGVLFPTANVKNEGKITLGMSEQIMQLSTTGYGSLREMKDCSLVEFFDLQVKELKTKIQDSISKGAKQEDIAEVTGLSTSQIDKLC